MRCEFEKSKLHGYPFAGVASSTSVPVFKYPGVDDLTVKLYTRDKRHRTRNNALLIPNVFQVVILYKRAHSEWLRGGYCTLVMHSLIPSCVWSCKVFQSLNLNGFLSSQLSFSTISITFIIEWRGMNMKRTGEDAIMTASFFPSAVWSFSCSWNNCQISAGDRSPRASFICLTLQHLRYTLVHCANLCQM